MEPQIPTHFVKFWAERTPEADAILAPGKRPLPYGVLWQNIEHVVRKLRGLGVKRNDRVATVLPKCPEAAVLYLGVSACSTSVPINVASRESDIDYALSTLGVKCVIVQAGMEEPATGVALRRGIPVAVLSSSTGGRAGEFRLQADRDPRQAELIFAEPEDFALVLQTSGTTARPKMVPHTHRAMTNGLMRLLEDYRITREDRSVNALPLFHVYGLCSALCAPLVKGGTVVCTQDFEAHRFFEWMDEFRPTWFAAVPRMLQALAAAAASHQDVLARHTLRFIRSASSPLHPKLLAELDRIFRVPILETYGLSEVCGQVTCEPLPPLPRKPGSVGRPTYHEVFAMDETGRLLGAREQGEIVVRGPSVMQGYLGDPKATEAAFRDGWLLTGDLGYLDEDGSPFITGRTKEIINRGGEKISPREVDDVLMDHPAVKLAVTFAVPHTTLGEDVAAAIVLVEGASASSRELRAFAAGRLAGHKAPRRILIVDDVPKGPTGKPQRIGLAAKLNIQATESVYQAPRNPLEIELAAIWTKLLGVERVGIHDDFFEIGGDSLLAVQMLDRLCAVTGRKVPVEVLFSGATIENLAEAFLVSDDATLLRMMAVQRSGSRPPLFLMHGDLASGGVYTMQLARNLGPDHPLYVLNPHPPDERKMLPAFPEMAAENLARLMEVYPAGPFYLAGWCNGAVVAYEMARQLRGMGKPVAMLLMLDPPSVSRKLRALTQRFQNVFAPGISPELAAIGPGLSESDRHRIENVKAYIRLVAEYEPQPYDGPVTLVWTAETWLKKSADATRGWGELVTAAEIRNIPGNHLECVTIYLDQSAACLREAIEAASAGAASATA